MIDQYQNKGEKSMAEKINMLHGKKVIVASCDDNGDRQCTIRSGCEKPHPFEAVDDKSGTVVHAFPAYVAKELREKGCTSNMMLV
jgi:hypothetical protein